jgi:hypothetical protein
MIKILISTPIANLLLPNWDPSKTNSGNNKRFGLVIKQFYFLEIMRVEKPNNDGKISVIIMII